MGCKSRTRPPNCFPAPTEENYAYETIVFCLIFDRRAEVTVNIEKPESQNAARFLSECAH